MYMTGGNGVSVDEMRIDDERTALTKFLSDNYFVCSFLGV